MAATVTLASTTLTVPVGLGDSQVSLASTSGVLPGLRLFVDSELMTVISLGISPWVNVRRGVDGTQTSGHTLSSTVWIGRADQFYGTDPVGQPAPVIPVAPYINVLNGKVWFVQGNPNDPRYWVLQTPTYSAGPFGIIGATVSPTSST